MDQIRIPADALVMVGDGSKALFLRNVGTATRPSLETQRVLEQDDAPTREQGTDRPGRRSDSGPGHKSAMSETDWHQLGEDRFAREIAQALYQAAHAGRYQKLVVVAPPRTLGMLRQEYRPEVSDRIIAEFPKTLTQHEVGQIERLIAWTD